MPRDHAKWSLRANIRLSPIITGIISWQREKWATGEKEMVSYSTSNILRVRLVTIICRFSRVLVNHVYGTVPCPASRFWTWWDHFKQEVIRLKTKFWSTVVPLALYNASKPPMWRFSLRDVFSYTEEFFIITPLNNSPDLSLKWSLFPICSAYTMYGFSDCFLEPIKAVRYWCLIGCWI